MGGFHLGRLVPFLVNAPVLSRNLLRAAMPCFVPRISGIYMELETRHDKYYNETCHATFFNIPQQANSPHSDSL